MIRFLLILTTFLLYSFGSLKGQTVYIGTLPGYNFSSYPNALEYKGTIKNNQANGYGTIYWKNGTSHEGIFENNKIQWGVLKKTYTDGGIDIGPNKNWLFDGPIIRISPDGWVSAIAMEKGYNVSNAISLFDIEAVKLKVVPLNLSRYNAEGKGIEDIHFIKGTDLIICVASKEYNSLGYMKYWLEVFDTKDNSIVRSIGSFSSPISTLSPVVIEEVDEDGMVYYSTTTSNITRFFKLNPFTGTKTPIEEYSKLTNQKDNGNTKSKTRWSPGAYDERKISSPMGGEAIYRNVEDGAKIEVVLSGQKKFEYFIEGRYVWDMVINPVTNKVVLGLGLSDNNNFSYNSLAILDSTSFHEFDIREGGGAQIFLSYSKDFTYLLAQKTGNGGTRIYRGEDLYFGLPQGTIFLNDRENIAGVWTGGELSFYDLEKRLIIAHHGLGELVGANFTDNYSLVSIAKEYTGDDGRTYIRTHDIGRVDFVFPEPLVSIPDFKRKAWEVLTASTNNDEFSARLENKDYVESNNSIDGENHSNGIDEYYEKMMNYYNFFSLLSGKDPLSGKSVCEWCNKEFNHGLQDGSFGFDKNSSSCKISEGGFYDYCCRDHAYKACTSR